MQRTPQQFAAKTDQFAHYLEEIRVHSLATKWQAGANTRQVELLRHQIVTMVRIHVLSRHGEPVRPVLVGVYCTIHGVASILLYVNMEVCIVYGIFNERLAFQSQCDSIFRSRLCTICYCD